ncbi:MAG: hypothetical protein OQK45_08050, partial [Sulfurovum sp.]|nr:hypothetical protein [Sulfurovum sp.]
DGQTLGNFLVVFIDQRVSECGVVLRGPIDPCICCLMGRCTTGLIYLIGQDPFKFGIRSEAGDALDDFR